jgi:hypothetical protein
MDDSDDEIPAAHHRGALVIGAAGTITIVGALLPWLYSGARPRSSFDLVALAQRLGLSPDGWQGLLLRLWPLVPLVCVLATVAAWWGRHRLAAGLALAAGVGSSWLSWRVRSADLGANLRLAIGPTVTLVGAVALVTAAALVHTRVVRAD